MKIKYWNIIVMIKYRIKISDTIFSMDKDPLAKTNYEAKKQ
jgi:hypothetical protein